MFQLLFQNIFLTLDTTSKTILKKLSSILAFAGGFGELTLRVFQEFTPINFKLCFQQIYEMGYKSLFLVLITALATGSVMALQFGLGLAKFGGQLYVPKLVSLGFLREMGPVFTSLLVAGRIGAGIASEVASMKTSQQIDAMRALGTSPIQKIVIPRLVGCMIAFPILTLIADFVGLTGAMFVSQAELGITPDYFLTKAMETVGMRDIVTGLIKTSVFAFFIGITACWKGLNTEGGTQGVGSTTTWVVVSSSVFIMISDFFLTKLFFLTFFKESI